MSERTIDAGIFTAFGYAKQGGYSGDAEDFANDLANIEGAPERPENNGGYYLNIDNDEASYEPITNIVSANPSSDGEYDFTATTFHGVTTRAWKARRPLPAPPSNDGTYVLKCTVSNGSVTYSWVAE